MQQFLWLCVALALLSGCASVSTFQTARTLDPKKGRMILGGSYLLGSSKYRPDGTGSIETSWGEVPIIEWAFRTAVVEHWDVGFKLTHPATLSGDIKYQWIDHKVFAAAAGVGVGYVTITTSGLLDNKGIRSHSADLSAPLYIGADLSRNFGIYVSPRLIARKNIDSSIPWAALLASTVGFRLGDTGGVLLECSYVFDLDSGANLTQVGIGIFFGSATSVPQLKREEPPKGENIPRRTVGFATRFLPDKGLVLISHPRTGQWRATDRICVWRAQEKIACGTIVDVNPDYAKAKLNFVKIPITDGSPVTPETYQWPSNGQ